jgi:hypothetical protein
MSEWLKSHVMESGFGVVSAGLVLVFRKLFCKVREIEAIKLGMQALLRDRIIQLYTKYSDRGYFPIYERENIQELSKQYFALGGNGVVHGLLEKLEALPTEPPNN